HQARLLRGPLPEVQHEAQRVAVDEHGVGVDDLVRALLHLDPERQVAHSRTTSTWPSLTTSVSLTRISVPLPALGAITGISIFIDSRIMRTSSSATSSPGFEVIFQTLPTSSAFTSIRRPSPRGPSAPAAAEHPRAMRRPRPAHGTGAPPLRPGLHCSSPSSPPQGRSCPPGRRECSRPW